MLRGAHPGLGREGWMKSWRQGFLERAVPFALTLSDDWFMCAEPGLTLLSLSPGQFETFAQGSHPVPGWRMAPWPFKNIMQTGIQNIVQNYGSICFLNCHPGRLFIFKFAVPQLAKYPSANLSLRISYHHVLLILNAAGRVIPFQGLRMGSCLTQKWTVQGDIHAWQSKRLYWEGSSWAESRRVREPRSTALIRGLQSQVLWRWDSFPGCLWPIILTQSLSWWHIHCSAEMDSSKKDSERLVGRVTSPFDLPEFFWLAVAY